MSIFGQDKNIKYLHFWTLSDLGLGALLEVSNDVLVGGSEPEGADRLGETGLPPGGGGGHAGGGGLVLPGDVSHLLGQVASVGQPVAPVDVVGCKAAVILISNTAQSFTNLYRFSCQLLELLEVVRLDHDDHLVIAHSDVGAAEEDAEVLVPVDHGVLRLQLGDHHRVVHCGGVSSLGVRRHDLTGNI